MTVIADELEATGMPGFDPADSTTWHPMNGPVVDALRGAAPMLGIRLGINLAPAAEHIARVLFQPAAICAASSPSRDSSSATALPIILRIGHLRYRVVEDDALVAEHSVREQGDYAGWSSAPLQTIALSTRNVRAGNAPLGADYRAEVLLHEVLHQCLRAADCDPDRDAKAGCVDVEERTVAAMAGPLLACLRDNPDLIPYLLAPREDS